MLKFRKAEFKKPAHPMYWLKILLQLKAFELKI